MILISTDLYRALSQMFGTQHNLGSAVIPSHKLHLIVQVCVYAGRLDGELKMHCHNAATWKFPAFSGQVACRGLDFHFWDAVDDLSKTDIDFVFDDQRLYMHNASGYFGSVPLTLSGANSIFPAQSVVWTIVRHNDDICQAALHCEHC